MRRGIGKRRDAPLTAHRVLGVDSLEVGRSDAGTTAVGPIAPAWGVVKASRCRRLRASPAVLGDDG